MFTGLITALKVLIVIATVIAVGILVYLKFIRKGDARIKVDTDEKPGKLKDCADFIPIDSISGNIFKIQGENRFLGSINCKGFDFFSSNLDEKLRTQEGYLNFVNIIQGPITLRIDSSAVDLSATINRHTEVYNTKYLEQGILYEQFTNYVKLFRNATTEAEKDLYQKTLNDIKHQLDINDWKMKHLESLINYQNIMSGRKASPIQEERYIFDWTFNPQDFPSDITEKEIFERAEKELDKREQRLRHALSAANVKVQRDGERELFDLFYRHFHPWSSDTFKTLADNNVDERIVSGKRSFDRARRNYEEALAAEDIMKAMQEKEKKEETEEKEEVKEPTFYIPKDQSEDTSEEDIWGEVDPEVVKKNAEIIEKIRRERAEAEAKSENEVATEESDTPADYEDNGEGGFLI